jgi:preprotein translocase subunit SecE
MSDNEKPDAPLEPASSEEDASSELHPEEGEERALATIDEGKSQIESPGEGESSEDDLAAGHVGVERYVHAAFFSLGILVAYIGGKILLSAWNSLADWPLAVKSLPFLIQFGEDERATITLVIGAVVGVLLVLRYYRRPTVRSWATQVAGELARVTWPSKEKVTNGTIVVLVAGAVATLYIALLDRLWGYLTNLVYGA